ncbi:MAG: ABC transporter ATP-binding protein [Flavobacterium psychrophilum]|nr:MAG: ABC transporter ATP-binding protein [Flavobacterium psychrophilum]
MSDSIIKIENVSKSYIIGHQKEERYTAFRDVIANNVKGVFNKFRSNGKEIKDAGRDSVEEFWALKDVSFDVKQGDRIGVIGRNGAGKSTLLKILSRITEPTTGSIRIRGRVASLLEVGTGFHPELTGRENIYLNGAILGMSRVEIKRKFDEIVDFAEVEKFLDTPVKRYSSGMYVRLAFAVAAHLEPEILIVDEVLAVGDAQFQKKCLGKMEQVSQGEGRTVLFVSHNMSSVLSFCNQCVWLAGGQVHMIGSSVNVINSYMSSQEKNKSLSWSSSNGTFSDTFFSITRFYITTNNQEASSLDSDILVNNDSYLHIEGNIGELNSNLKIGYLVYNSKDELVFSSFINGHTDERNKFTLGVNKYKMKLPVDVLVSDDYKVCFFAGIYYQKWICHPPYSCPEIFFRVIEPSSEYPFWNDREKGIFQPQNDFEKY